MSLIEKLLSWQLFGALSVFGVLSMLGLVLIGKIEQKISHLDLHERVMDGLLYPLVNSINLVIFFSLSHSLLLPFELISFPYQTLFHVFLMTQLILYWLPIFRHFDPFVFLSLSWLGLVILYSTQLQQTPFKIHLPPWDYILSSFLLAWLGYLASIRFAHAMAKKQRRRLSFQDLEEGIFQLTQLAFQSPAILLSAHFVRID